MKKKVAKPKPLIKTKKKFKTVVSFDMGTKNMAYAVLTNGTLKQLGFFDDTITNLIDPYFNMDLDKFVIGFVDLLTKNKPNAVVAERFQNRGMFRGNGSELINIMIGLMARICHERKIYFYLLTAAQWKNVFNRQFKHLSKTILVKKRVKREEVEVEKKLTALEVLYEEILPFPNHPIDAHLQGVYFSNMWQTSGPYSKWRKAQLKKLAKIWVKENRVGSKVKRKK